MSIDDKLREIVGAIIYDGHKNGVTTPTEPWVVNIKQAFADEGYVQFKYEPGAKVFTEEEGLQLLLDKGFMTGQEWYDRFEKELDKMSDTKNLWVGTGIDKAAKKAARLE